MARPAVMERPIHPADEDLETLLTEHRHWRARLREAIEDSKRVRTNAADFCLYCRAAFLTRPH